MALHRFRRGRPGLPIKNAFAEAAQQGPKIHHVRRMAAVFGEARFRLQPKQEMIGGLSSRQTLQFYLLIQTISPSSLLKLADRTRQIQHWLIRRLSMDDNETL